jgi:hypothetical protein
VKPSEFYASIAGAPDLFPELGQQRYIEIKSAADYATRFPSKPHGYDGPGRYNMRSGYMLDLPQRPEPCAPYIIPDIPTHIGPSGSIVHSRSDQRDEFKRSNTVIHEPLDKRPRGKDGYANKRWTKKRGVQWSEAAHEWNANEKARIAGDDATFKTVQAAVQGIHTIGPRNDRESQRQLGKHIDTVTNVVTKRLKSAGK